jgi:hypothetical protein
MRVIRTPVRAPNANAYAERVIETLRAECLDWTLVWGPGHLDRTLRTYAEHYNRQRPHRAVGLAPPLAGVPISDPITSPVNPGGVRRRDLLGGLIHEYARVAARSNRGFRPPRGRSGRGERISADTFQLSVRIVGGAELRLPDRVSDIA